MTRRAEDNPGFTPYSQMALFWRILHLMLARYGNHPMGQLLVALTMVFLNERGMPPTLTDICRATGLPKSSVSRYVAWQIGQGLAKETVDPNDRRKRYLVQTPKGRAEWQWQVAELKRVFSEITDLDRQLYQSGGKRDAQALLERMSALTNEAPTRSVKFPSGKKRAVSKASQTPKS
jgi:DNA-binding MarR family transcriptional regulator